MRAILLLLALLPATAARAGDDSRLTGVWIVDGGFAAIELTRCGAQICGRIAGVTSERPGGPLPVDAQGRPQCGRVLLLGLREVGPQRWRGRIEVPADGHHSPAELSLDVADRLSLHGHFGPAAFGFDQLWSRFTGTIGPDCRLPGPTAP